MSERNRRKRPLECLVFGSDIDSVFTRIFRNTYNQENHKKSLKLYEASMKRQIEFEARKATHAERMAVLIRSSSASFDKTPLEILACVAKKEAVCERIA